MYGLRNIRSLAGNRGLLSNLYRGIGRRRLKIGNHGPRRLQNQANNLIGDIKNKQSNAALKTELKSYSKIAVGSLDKLGDIGSKLVSQEKISMFQNAESTGMTSNITNKAGDFINNFNNAISSLTKLGGKENTEMLTKLKEFAKANEEEFAKAGITVLKDGSLRVDGRKLKAAELSTLKKLFNGKDSFAGKVVALSPKIKENVEKKLEENLKILGGDKNWYGKNKIKSPLTKREMLESLAGRHLNKKI